MKRFLSILLVLCMVLVPLSGCSMDAVVGTTGQEIYVDGNTKEQSGEHAENERDQLTVHYIDVGQADCVLVQNQGNSILIDAGNEEDYPVISNYLDQLKVTELQAVILSHPHEDHIGSAAAILKHYKMDGPVYTSSDTAASQVYRDLQAVIKQKKITEIQAQSGKRFAVGDMEFQILAPNGEYEDTNEMSVIVRMTYGKNNFLFTGDAGKASELDVLKQGYELESDVLKVGHHGSETSSSYPFLKEVNPQYAVIMCGQDNSYGHPHEGALSRLNDVGAMVYRTDTMGTVVATCDGKRITFDQKGISSNQEHQDTVQKAKYIGNANSKKFHIPTCNSLPEPQNQVLFQSQKAAIKAGYEPCKRCIGNE